MNELNIPRELSEWTRKVEKKNVFAIELKKER